MEDFIFCPVIVNNRKNDFYLFSDAFFVVKEVHKLLHVILTTSIMTFWLVTFAERQITVIYGELKQYKLIYRPEKSRIGFYSVLYILVFEYNNVL